jgi:outer membrane protein assembly factor BamB
MTASVLLADGELTLGVIPTVLVGGPLALLAILFPAVFGGLLLVLRRWTAALTVLGVNSTLYLVHWWFGPSLFGSFWGEPRTFWLATLIVTALGVLWAWRRQAGVSPHPQSLSSEERGEKMQSRKRPNAPGLTELIVLAVVGVSCLGGLAVSLYLAAGRLDLWGKTLLAITCGVWAGILHTGLRYWRNPVKGLPGEGVLLWVTLVAGILLSGSFAAPAVLPPAKAEKGTFGVVWRYRPQPPCWIASSPAVEGDRVFVGVVHGGALRRWGAIHCVDAATGTPLWTFNDGGRMKDVFSSPVVVGGRVYVGEGFHQHNDCKLYCLDAATGEKVWDFPTASHTESTPAVIDGKVYFGAGDDGLYCVEAATGKEVWHYEGLHVDANPLIAGGRVYGGSGVGDFFRETALFCLDAGTGQEVWRVPTDLPVWAMPALRGKYLFAGMGNGNFLESAPDAAGAVLCLEAATGRRIWRYDCKDGVHTRVDVDADHVYCAARDGSVLCLGRQEGELVWRQGLDSGVVASPALADGPLGFSLYAISTLGRVYRLDRDARGAVVWQFDVEGDTDQWAQMFSSPAVVARQTSGGERRRIYFGAGLSNFSEGVLYCLEDRVNRRARDEGEKGGE